MINKKSLTRLLMPLAISAGLVGCAGNLSSQGYVSARPEASYASHLNMERIAVVSNENRVESPETSLVMGRIYDEERGGPIKNVVVLVDGTNNAGFSDEHGRYKIKGVRQGTNGLHIMAEGYQKVVVMKNVDSPMEFVDIRLNKNHR